MSGGPEHSHSTCFTVGFVEAVAFVQSGQIILSGLTPPSLPLCHCCDWCLFRPAALFQLRKKKLPILLTSTLTWLFPPNTHENTQPWLSCSLSYFSQISLSSLPFFQSFKGMPCSPLRYRRADLCKRGVCMFEGFQWTDRICSCSNAVRQIHQ